MQSVDLSCIKRSSFGGYKLKDKQYDELVKNIEKDEQTRQRLFEENARLENELKQAGLEIQQCKNYSDNLESKFKSSQTFLQAQVDLNAKQKAEYDLLARQFSDFENNVARDREAVLEKENKLGKKLQQLKEEFARLSAKHQSELDQQREQLSAKCQTELDQQKQVYEQIIERLQTENAKFLQQKEDALLDMSTVRDAQTKTERRRKQLEAELAKCQCALEKEANEKLRLEVKLEKLREGKEPEINDLLIQLEAAKDHTIQAIEQLTQYRQGTKNAQLALPNQNNQERMDYGDAQNKLEFLHD